MSIYDFFIKVGDTLPWIEAVLEDAVGPVVLTGASVRFKMRLQGTTTPLKVDAAAVIDAAAAAEVHYAWLSADTDTAGIYEAEWEVTLPSGAKLTFPNDRHLQVMVRAAVG